MQKRLLWWQNIPLISYILLRGKCHACRAPISFLYPMVEFLCGLLFVSTELKFGWGLHLFLRDWPFVFILLCVTFIDLEHLIIPNRFSLGGLVLGILTSFLPGVDGGWQLSLSGAILGYGFFYILSWLYYKATGRSGLGGGDVKLLAMIGAFLGPPGVFVTLLLSSLLGSFVGILWALSQRKRNVFRVAIPYGPFLVIGALCEYLIGGLFEWLPFTIPI